MGTAIRPCRTLTQEIALLAARVAPCKTLFYRDRRFVYAKASSS